MSEERLLAVFAHPDDESLLAGGTLAFCRAAGVEIRLVSATRGEMGPVAEDVGVDRGSLGAVREQELRAAAAALGIESVACLDFPDGELKWVEAPGLAERVLEMLRMWRPTILLTFDSQGLYWHPDHIAVHEQVLRAVGCLRAGDRPSVYCATLPDGMMAAMVAAVRQRGLPADLWGLAPEDFGVPEEQITTTVDVRPFLAAKLRALRSHRTQLGPTNLLAAIPDDLAERYLGREYFIHAGRAGDRADRLSALRFKSTVAPEALRR
ncbi:MAG TPA: PIG-L deacetylase family protein [Chloroflexota bacterium]|nr:PIG-L deacetylase family protein [Chloroflexota bacterium]